MKARNIAIGLGIVALVVTTDLITDLLKPAFNQGIVQTKETLYDRVIKSGKIRCGYVTYVPGLSKDPNTGMLSGTFFDIVEAMAKSLELEIEWTEEVGWGSMIEGLKTDRYDMVCSGVFPTSSRGKAADFSIPLYYYGVGVFVPEGDNRFKNNLSAINSENVKISTIDGEVSDYITQTQFPKAKRLSLPQLSEISQSLLNVAQGKADVTFVDTFIGYEFIQKNPGSVKNITLENPLRIIGVSLMFRKNEPEFKSMINVALTGLINDGFISEIFERYEFPPGTLYPPALNYQIPQQESKK